MFGNLVEGPLLQRARVSDHRTAHSDILRFYLSVMVQREKVKEKPARSFLFSFLVSF